MPRYRVTERRSFVERWLIEAADEEAAKARDGEIIDENDHAWHDSEAESIEVELAGDDEEIL